MEPQVGTFAEHVKEKAAAEGQTRKQINNKGKEIFGVREEFTEASEIQGGTLYTGSTKHVKGESLRTERSSYAKNLGETDENQS